MNKHEKLFFAIWAIIAFPLLMIFLVMHEGLDKSLVGSFLTFMASISSVYLGARAFDNWNSSTPTTPEEPPVDDGDH